MCHPLRPSKGQTSLAARVHGWRGVLGRYRERAHPKELWTVLGDEDDWKARRALPSPPPSPCPAAATFSLVHAYTDDTFMDLILAAFPASVALYNLTTAGVGVTLSTLQLKWR